MLVIENSNRKIFLFWSLPITDIEALSIVPEVKRPISEGKNIALYDFYLTVTGAIIPVEVVNLIVHYKIHMIVM